MLGSFILFASLALVPVDAASSPSDSTLDLSSRQLDEQAFAEFNAAVNEYVWLHRLLERSIRPEQTSENPEEMLAAADSLADALRAARPNARRGNIFAAGPAGLFRRIVDETMQRYGYEPRELIDWLNDEPLPGARRPKVNGRYDWRLGAWMWPALLMELPPLPSELEYRLIGNELVLIDLHADLVVDILENAVYVDE
jgi:hypothetical protein